MNGIERKRGDTYPIVATLSTPAGVIDITGATEISLAVSDKRHADVGGGSKLLELPGTIANAVQGQVTFSVSPANSMVLTPGSYSADVTFKLGGVVYTVPTFDFVVNGRIAAVPA